MSYPSHPLYVHRVCPIFDPFWLFFVTLLASGVVVVVWCRAGGVSHGGHVLMCRGGGVVVVKKGGGVEVTSPSNHAHRAKI